MGLDMFLTARRTYSEHYGAKPPTVAEVPEPFVVRAVEVEAAYWRKANAIHAWFVKHVQNGVDECQKADVSGAQLKTLRDLCAELLASRDVAAVAEKLPPQSGFFFGSTAVDENYWGDLAETVSMIDAAFATLPPYMLDVEPKGDWDYSYQSSW